MATRLVCVADGTVIAEGPPARVLASEAVQAAYLLYLVASHGVSPFAGIAAAAVIAALVALPVSALLLRLSGGYFAVASLVVAALFQIAVTLAPSVGGTTGVSLPGLAGYDPVLREALIYWAAMIVAVVCVAGVFLLVRAG